MRAWRFTVIAVIMALVVAAAVLERRDDLQSSRAGSSFDAFSLAKLMPTAARPGAAGSVWFCAAGTATGRDDGLAEQTVVVLNVSGAPIAAKLTVFPDHGEPVAHDLEVAPFSRRDVSVADLLTADHAAVLVELSGGEAAVEHVLRGPDGAAVAACSSTSSNRWYVPAGSTAPGSREILAIFNPFPEDASVDLAFETEDGRRTPEKYANLLVRGSAVTPVDITDVVTVRDQVAALVTVGSGRVAVDHLQVFDGSEGHLRGLSVSPGAPVPSPQWFLPGGFPDRDGLDQSVVVLDPSEQSAQIEVQVRQADSGRTFEPYDAEVRSGQYSEISVLSDGRVPDAQGASLTAVSTNQVPVVASHVVRAEAPNDGEEVTGVAYTLGSPLLARRWVVPAATFTGSTGAAVVVANPTDQDVAVTVNAVRDGTSGTVQGFDERHVPPGARLTVDVDALDDDHTGIEVVATGPVVVEHRLQFRSPDDVALAIGVPVDGTLVDIPIAPLTEVDLDVAPDGTDLPPGIELPVPGTGVDGTLPTTPGTAGGLDPTASSTSSTQFGTQLVPGQPAPG